MEDTIETLKQQHFETYKKAILDSISNNTKALVDEDIASLIKKPPLDSMDLIKSKFLDLAKKNKIILDTEKLSKLMDSYRSSMQKCTKEIKKIREEELSKKVNSYDGEKEEIIKLLKKDFTGVNKKLVKLIKDQLKLSCDKFSSKMNTVYTNDTPEEVVNKINKEMMKYVTGLYQRQFLESVDIKILIKDTTLINIVKEQTERYLFTLSNSRLFKDNI